MCCATGRRAAGCVCSTFTASRPGGTGWSVSPRPHFICPGRLALYRNAKLPSSSFLSALITGEVQKVLGEPSMVWCGQSWSEFQHSHHPHSHPPHPHCLKHSFYISGLKTVMLTYIHSWDESTWLVVFLVAQWSTIKHKSNHYVGSIIYYA